MLSIKEGNYMSNVFTALKEDKQPLGKTLINGLGVLMACFGATVLVPAILGINAAPVLLALGIGVILALIITGFKVPYFLSSSFAFIAAAQWSLAEFGQAVTAGSIIMSGIPYLILALLIKIIGIKAIQKAFSPVVLGCTVLAIATSLMPVAIGSATTLGGVYSLKAVLISAIILVVILLTQFKLKLASVSVLVGIAVGYIICYVMGLVDFVRPAFFINPLADWTLPRFNPSSFIPFMILAISTMSEHLSDIAAIGSVTGKDYYADPGVHRTLISDGIGNMISGLFGNPVSSTTYGENTAWCAISKEFSAKNQLTAGIFLIFLSFFGFFSAFLGSIPAVVIGAVSLVLYGMIAAAGLSLLVRNQVDFNIPRNLIIASIVLSLAIGGFVLQIGDFQLSSIACGTIAGIILNLVIPEKKIV
jgi:uracil permease